MSVVPVCDCDGTGPMPSFLQDPGGDLGYYDGWLCQCVAGTWQCLLRDQSGASCFLVCPRDGGADATSRVDAGHPDAQ